MSYRIKCKLGNCENNAQCESVEPVSMFTEEVTHYKGTKKTLKEITLYCEQSYGNCELQEKEVIKTEQDDMLDKAIKRADKEIEQLKEANKMLSDRLNGTKDSPLMYMIGIDYANTGQSD